jgi:hypothetical protein
MTQLKSLAHPDWPYAGTAHEWRGFVKSERKNIRVGELSDEMREQLRNAIYQKQNFGPELK